MIRNVAFVGPAGIGKTTLAKVMEEHMGYRRHALANPLKVGQAYLIMWQLGLPIVDRFFPAYLKNVQRILNGQMGVWEGHNSIKSYARQEHWVYNEDKKVRDFLLDFIIEHKVEVRGLLQQYGTEVIRGVGAKLFPEREKTDEETWIKIVLRESETDNRMGFSVCCDDVRYPHEADAFRKHGWEIVRVNRSNKERGIGITDENVSHSSEQMHMNITATAEYNNDLKLELAAGHLESLFQKDNTLIS